MNERSIFLAALDIADLTERAAYVATTCADDPALGRRVLALLASHERSGEFLDVPAVEQIEASASRADDGTLAFNPANKQGPAAGPLDTNVDSPNEKVADVLECLQPSTRPGSLGRLGHYEVLEILGQGGFGTVVKAFDEKLHRMVAIKLMSSELAATSPARKRFLREARASAAVRHENVVSIYAVEDSPVPHLVMEFIDGETLQQRLDRVGPLDTRDVLRIGQQIASGLAAAHAMGLIHRDIKPANILLENGFDRVKITDFGLARAADDASMTQSGVIAGTPLYMSPEQAQGDPIDQRSDLFSFGSVLYVMCSGRPPFRAPSILKVLQRVAEDQPRPLQEIIPEVPEWLSAPIARLHAKKPGERFASAKEVADLLGRYLSELQLRGSVQSPAPVPVPVPAVAPKPAPSHGRWKVAAGAILALLIGLVFSEATGTTNVFHRLFSSDGTRPRVPVRADAAEWEKSVAAMPAERQVEAVKARLMELNPGFDGKVIHQVEEGVVVELRFVTDRVTDISPIRVFNGLKILDCSGTATPDGRGNGQLADLKPLKGMNLAGLTELRLNGTHVSDAGLAHFEGCKSLVFLYLNGTRVSDAGLANFKDCKKLEVLSLNRTKVGDAGLANFKDCKNLATISLVGTEVSDAGLANFKDCKNLTYLYLNDTEVGDEGLAHFAGCKKLTELYLGGTRASDAGLAHFAGCNNLSYAILWGTKVSDAGLAHLEGCKALAYLNLQKTSVTAPKIEALKKALPVCKIEWDGSVIEPKGPVDDAWVAQVAALPAEKQVEVVKAKLMELNPGFDGTMKHQVNDGAVRGVWFVTDQVTDISPIRVFNSLWILDCSGTRTPDGQGNGQLTDLTPLKGMNLSNLTLLNLGRTKVGDAGLAHFKDCKNLMELNLDGMKVSEAGLAHFKDCKSLTGLYLLGTEVTDAGLAHFAGCKNLTQLNLWTTRVGDTGLAHFKDCLSLTKLVLGYTQVGDKGLAHLEGCKKLTTLNLHGTQVTDAGLTSLEGCKNLIHLQLQKTNVTAARVEALKQALPACKIEWDGGVIEPR